VSQFHLKLGGGYELSKNEAAPVAMVAIANPRFEIAGAAIFAEEIGYEFSGVYFFSLMPRGFKRFGVGAGYDTEFKIPIAKLMIRFPIAIGKKPCKDCPYDRY
jgi:hypothetical protein